MSVDQAWLVVIPARLGSTRLPNKPLQLIAGIPMIARVYQRIASLTAPRTQILVATDAQEIADICGQLSIPCEMTRSTHTTGTERCGEVALRHSCRFILNVQGDEPFIHVNDLKNLMAALEAEASLDIATLAYKSQSKEDFQNPNVVKCVVSGSEQALYFSRSPIPYYRDPTQAFSFLQHQGVYAFRRSSLMRFLELARSPLEECESLEQLRALQAGMNIKIVYAKEKSFGIDTAEDLENARAMLSPPVSKRS
jgi:3-deoxy-manno-octulosonate cytidylyltransferase (CMP-KDO synthetase)